MTADSAYGMTPTGLLAEADALSERFTAVHATHLVDADFALLGASGKRSVPLSDDGA